MTFQGHPWSMDGYKPHYDFLNIEYEYLEFGYGQGNKPKS
jgi:hypothetical protein